MAEVWIEEALKWLAEGCADQEGGQPGTAQHWMAFLRPKLLPLLKAGQAMREEMRDFERHEQAGYFVSHEKWESAVAALKAANGQ